MTASSSLLIGACDVAARFPKRLLKVLVSLLILLRYRREDFLESEGEVSLRDEDIPCERGVRETLLQSVQLGLSHEGTDVCA